MKKTAEKMGFELHPIGTYYMPMFMHCRVVPADTDCVQNAKKLTALGRHCSDYKKLHQSKTYGLWVMYGRDDSGNSGLYFKEAKDPKAYRLIEGQLRFVFDPAAFAHIALNADCATLEYFLRHAVVRDSEDVIRFYKLTNGGISERKRNLVSDCLCLAKNVTFRK